MVAFFYCLEASVLLRFVSLLLTVTVALLLWVCAEMGMYVYEMRVWRQSFIVDLDRARQQMLATSQYMYMRGCQQGVDYPPEYRQAVNGFNSHSPMNYCNTEATKWQDYLEQQAMRLGRP